MIEKILHWFNTYDTELTWFIIGLLINNCIIHLGRGMLDLAALDLIIAGVNYYFWRSKRV